MEKPGVIYEFGKFTLDPGERVLLVDREPVHLSDKVFDTLLLLIRNNGKLLTKDEMMSSIWEESFVEEGNLAKNVSRLRKILNSGGVDLIQTLPRRGYRFQADVREIDADTDVLVHRHLRIMLSQASSIENGTEAGLTPDQIQIIAVLPFQPLNPRATDEIFGLGLTDALITQMNRGGQVQVRPTSSILKYNVSGQDPLAAARELNANSVLEGRFQRVENKLRLNVQLLRTRDGASLWADSFNAEVDDIFTLQDVIAERVVVALTKKLSDEARLKLVKRDTENVEAYREYVTGRYFWNKRTAEGYDKALRCYQKAIEIDGRYALAYAGLADIYNLLPIYDGFAPQDYFPKAKAAALKALEIDENLAEAHAALGLAILHYDWNWPGAEVSFQRAINLNPNLSTGYELMGVYLCRVGRVGEAIAALKKAHELDPLSPINATWLGEVFRYCGQPEAAVSLHEQTLAAFPEFYLAHYHAAFAFLDLGRLEQAELHSEKAVALSDGNSLTLSLRGILQAAVGNVSGVRETMARLIKLKGEKYISSVNIASVFAASGDEKNTLEWLERAREEHDPNLTWIKFDKEFKFLGLQPRFQMLLREVGLADSEQQKFPAGIAPPLRRKRLLPALLLLGFILISAGWIFLWKSRPHSANSQRDPIRLTNDPAAENNARWAKDGAIRFLSTGSDGLARSMKLNADGTNQTEVECIDNLSSGAWSPDGTKLIFWKKGDKTSTYVANADGSGETVLPISGGGFDWSSDDKRVVYQKRYSAGDADIFVYDLETGKNENVTNNPAFDADPSFSPDGSQIVFASLRDGNAEIYLMSSDGTNVRRLTEHPAWESHPVFSPDGTQIAFSADRENEAGNTYLMNPDGTGIRRLTDWKFGDYVVPGGWSPDGTKILFSSDGEGSDDIFVTSAEVFHPRQLLSDNDKNLGFPSYSPDGKQIVYQVETKDKGGEIRTFNLETREGSLVLATVDPHISPIFTPDGSRIIFHNRVGSSMEICAVKTDGTDLVNLTNDPSKDVDPAVSPDGTKIVFASNRGGNYGIFDLYVMNADGGDQRQIYSNRDGMSVSPTWSADGKEIAFANDREGGRIGNFEIYKIMPETGTETRLTFLSRYDGTPSFSPDGRRIAFSSNSDGNSEIYMMNADGSGRLRITRDLADDVSPRWSPAGRLIFISNRDGKYAIYEVEL
ncbi:MAG: winged helix-turn-helix domain-containing protein [Pyrinomonadaceae bacterium]